MLAGSDERRILQEQLDYYRARAAEYDEWFFRTGRYNRGAEHRAAWESEIERIESALAATLPDGGHILELACGTGLWTRHLIQRGAHVVAVDASPEVLAINKSRLQGQPVEFIQADLFSWTPPGARFDLVFFGFWLSHVPDARFDGFWELVRHALKPGGTAFFVDSQLDQTSTAINHVPVDESGISLRHLNDGREFRIVKIFHRPSPLQERLEALGWRGWVKSSGRFFVYGRLAAG
jgi:SAM-dependent methyltransferase